MAVTLNTRGFSDEMFDSFKGDALPSIQRFNRGYLDPERISFIDRSGNVAGGALLGVLSLIGQVIKLFDDIIHGEREKAMQKGKNLVQTVIIVPVGTVLGVVFIGHYLGIELPRKLYKNFANTQTLVSPNALLPSFMRA